MAFCFQIAYAYAYLIHNAGKEEKEKTM